MSTRKLTTRRAAFFRHRARELAEKAPTVRDQADRRHMLDLAQTYQRIADTLAPIRQPSDSQCKGGMVTVTVGQG